MGKKKRKKIKKPGKAKILPKDYEVFSHGPLRIERFGRMVKFSSDWEPGEFDRHMERLRRGRPEHKEKINEQISSLLSLIDQFEPLELLSTVSIRNTFSLSVADEGGAKERKECYVEYAQSLILSQNRKHGLRHATEEVIEEFNRLIEEIFNDVLWYFGSEVAEGRRSEIEETLRFLSILRYLFVRGDSYPEHHIGMVRDIFTEHDEFLKKNYGFDTESVITCIKSIEGQLLTNMQKQADTFGVNPSNWTHCW